MSEHCLKEIKIVIFVSFNTCHLVAFFKIYSQIDHGKSNRSAMSTDQLVIPFFAKKETRFVRVSLSRNYICF